MKRNLLLPMIAIVILALATISIVRTQPQRESADPPHSPPRAPLDFDQRVAAVGLVEASSENISLSAHLAGVVEKVFVHVGQQVEQGAPLVKLDTRSLEAQLAERRAELATREAGVASAQAQALVARAALAETQRLLVIAESVSDIRSISREELTRRRSAVEISEAEVQAADAAIKSAEAAMTAAQAAIASMETEIDRSTIVAPIDGQVLQLRIRAGEFAPAGVAAQPWLIVGDVSPLHIRVDIDEHEAWRLRPNARAVGQVRGNASLVTPLTFVRFEPFVVPKLSLTGASTERVDTRVMQAIYRIDNADLSVFVGQQMDVFIDASESSPSPPG